MAPAPRKWGQWGAQACKQERSRWRRRKEQAEARSWETAACAEFQEFRPVAAAALVKIVTIGAVCGGKISMATKESTNQRRRGEESELKMKLILISGWNRRSVKTDFIPGKDGDVDVPRLSAVQFVLLVPHLPAKAN